MAIEYVPINTGTSARVMCDQSGTGTAAQYAQVVKIVQGGDGVFDSLASTLAVSGTMSVSAITTILGTVAVSGGGGGVQYPVDSTAMGATGTGTLILGMQSGGTTGRGIAVTTTGAQFVTFVGTPAVTAANVTIASVTTGTMSVVNVLSASGVTIASIATGTVSIVGTPAITASGVTIASVATGTVHVTNVLSATGVLVAALTTGTVNVVNVLSASGVTVASLTTGTVNIAAIAAGTNNIGSFVGTAHASRWNAYAVNTTSGASVIVKTSGAHTLYITDMILSVDVPSRVDIYSAATTQMSLYLATKGGLAVGLSTPLILNSNQSLTFTPSASGSAMLWAGGYTVT